ncbi:MAG TPA: TMEM175 family protein [Actinomycetota bacterium]|nr:TMEM175 family protein [Actinomycetota bacterium]
MASEEGTAERREERAAARVEAFSDGVMAVIITIMAFNLKAPAGSSFKDMRAELPALLVYILSFTYVGIYWVNHHHLLRAARGINGAVMWANLSVLFWLSLTPVMTEWVSKEYNHSLPAAAYGTVCLGAGVAYSVLVQALVRCNGKDSAVARAIGDDRKGYASLVIYLAAVLLSAIKPWIAYALYAGVALMWFIPDRRFSRQEDAE